MKTDNVLYWIIYFIVSIIVAWIAFSLILVWFKPALYHANGSVNWWVTLWVAILIIVFAWIIMIILTWIVRLFSSGGCRKECDPCEKKVECDPCAKKVECDPCAKGKYMAPQGFDPRMWMY